MDAEVIGEPLGCRKWWPRVAGGQAERSRSRSTLSGSFIESGAVIAEILDPLLLLHRISRDTNHTD